MYILPIQIIFVLIFARICSCYDSRISKGKYVTIKNNTLAKLLIDNEHFFYKGKRTLKKDRNKLSVVGLIFYLCVVFIVVLTFIFLLLPQIPCEPFELDSTKIYLYADTLNEKIPLIFSIILMCVEIIYIAVLLFQYRNEIAQKGIRIFTCVCSLFMGLVSFIVIIEMIFELLK